MSNIFHGQKAIASISAALTLFVAALVSAPPVQAAAHNISLSAEVLPNGQVGYKRNGEDKAVIPGPTVFVKQGDTVTLSVTNNTGKPVGLKVPSLKNGGAAKAAPGGTASYSFTASKTGAYAYLGDGQELLGLFGAIVVDGTDGKVESYVNGDGAITSAKAADLAKQYVLFMVGSTFWGAEISELEHKRRCGPTRPSAQSRGISSGSMSFQQDLAIPSTCMRTAGSSREPTAPLMSDCWPTVPIAILLPLKREQA